VPKASRHIAYPQTPRILRGVSPVEAGRKALEVGTGARDAAGRRLRADGRLLVAGVASYPIPRDIFYQMPAEGDIYSWWCTQTCDWLEGQFGVHFVSAVEHRDENFNHLHFYLVPSQLPDGRLNLHEFHPGRRMKHDAAEVGASKKDQDTAYRRGMERWQDEYHYDVSEYFGHKRWGVKRWRLERMEQKKNKEMEEERQSMLEEIKRHRVEIEEAARRRGHELYSLPYANLQKQHAQLSAAYAAAEKLRRAAEAEVEELRARLFALGAAAPAV
jgi:hypothetical protein